MGEQVSGGIGREAGAGGNREPETKTGEIVILEMAMNKETWARRYYEEIYRFVEREDSRELLQALIREEQRHYELLMDVRLSEDFTKLGVDFDEETLTAPDYLVREEIRKLSGPEEIVRLAIRREEEAEEFYLSRVGMISNKRLRELYERLAREEARHREQLLRAYDELVIMSRA